MEFLFLPTTIQGASSQYNKLNEFRKQGLFTDVTLNVSSKTDKRPFPVHKNILAASSDYFKTLLAGVFLETGQQVININDVDPNLFDKVLNIIYGQKVDISGWQEKLHILFLLKFFLIEGVDIEKEATQVKVPAEDSLAYITLLYQLLGSPLPQQVLPKLNQILDLRQYTGEIPEEVQTYMAKIPFIETLSFKVIQRFIQRAQNNLNQPIKIYTAEGKDEEPHCVAFNRREFRAHSIEEVILQLRDYILSDDVNYIGGEFCIGRDILSTDVMIYYIDLFIEYEGVSEEITDENINNIVDRLIDEYKGKFYIKPNPIDTDANRQQEFPLVRFP